MAIYFPRGFHSGEAVRIVDGITVIAGKLARVKTDLLLLAVERGPLGGIGGPMARQAREVLAAAGPRTRADVRALPRETGAIHFVSRGKLASRQLAVLDLDEAPSTGVERMRLVARIVDCALICNAREVALGPFEAGEDGARATLDALRKGWPRPEEGGGDAAAREPLRALLILPDPRIFRAVVGDTSCGGPPQTGR